MRIFGILSLLVALAVVGLVAKKQLGSTSRAPAAASVPGGPTIDTTAAPKQQVDQFKQAVESAVQQPRPVPDEPK